MLTVCVFPANTQTLFSKTLIPPNGFFFLRETKDRFTAIEIKSTTRWDKRYNRGLHRIQKELAPRNVTCHGIYRGERDALWDDIQIHPAMDFLKKLWAGSVFQP